MEFSQAWSLLLVSFAAVLLPGISRLLRLPAIVLEIGFGIVLGKSLLNLTFSGNWLSFLAELGFLMLMFHAGMELDFNILRRQSKAQIALQGGYFGLTFLLALAGAVLLNRGMFIALVLTTTSLGLVVPTLKEAKLNKTDLGQSILIAASLADFLTLLGITFFVLWHQYGLDLQLLSPLLLFAGFGFLLKMARLWAWWHPDKAQRLLMPKDSQELGVRLSMALLFLFVAISQLVHIEPVLGAFMGGAILSIIFKEKGNLEDKLSGMGYGFLIPIFFIHVGMGFDLKNVASLTYLIFAFEMLIISFAVKLIPSLLFRSKDVSWFEALNAGVLLSSRMSLIIVAASIGLEFGFIDERIKDTIVLLAVFTCLIGPSLFRILYRPREEIEKADKKLRPRDVFTGWKK